MEFEDGQEEEGPLFPWVPPDDRLWRHPSEVGNPALPAGAASGPPASPPVGRRSAHHARGGPRLWSVALASGVAGALVVAAVLVATGSLRPRTVIEPVSTPKITVATVPSPIPPVPMAGDWAAIADEMAPSVVSVDIDANGPEQGSGVLFTAMHGHSYVLTADDLFANGSSDVTVVTSSGRTVAATLVGGDPTSGIAVLSIPGVDYVVPPIGSVSGMQVASPVLAVGGRSGGNPAIQAGNVANVDTGLTSSTGVTMLGMIAVSNVDTSQTSDGGALVDAQDSVVGIYTDLTAVSSGNSGFGYAIPIDVASHVADQLIARQRPTHPWIGIDDASDAPMSSAEPAGGAVVGAVQPGSPASQAGIADNDTIVSFDGQAVTSSGRLVYLLSQCQENRSVSIAYLTDGVRHHASVQVQEQPSDPDL